MPLETVVFYTMQTSASASGMRILNEINERERQKWLLGHERFVRGNDFRFAWRDIQPEGQLVFANCPAELGPIQDLAGQRFIVNFRDPRDRLCNAFMWQLIHPHYPDEPSEDIEARAVQVRALGIDRWIEQGVGRGPLGKHDDVRLFMENVGRIPADKRHILTYARLCLDFDSFLNGCFEAMGKRATPTLRAKLEIERTEKLDQNPRWIGNQWSGSDVMPGRYRRELKPDTIAYLSEKYAPVLRAMAQFDPDYADLYLRDVPPGKTTIATGAISPAPKKISANDQPFHRHMIVDRPDIRIEHFRSKERSETLAFTFTDRESRNLADPGFATGFLLSHGFDVVAIKTNRSIWFENLVDDDVLDIERWLSWSDSPYACRLGYGSSMGAYAAIRMSRSLRLDRVLALSPLFDIKNDWESRWRADREAMSADRTMFSLEGGGPTEQISDRCDYMMIYDPLTDDAKHVRLFERIISADRLKLMPLPYSGHPSGPYLVDLKMLAPVALSALREGMFPSIADARRLHKRTSATYLFNLAEHCLRRRHLQWALAINALLIAISDHPEYHVQTGKILDRLARLEEAIGALDRALSWPDYWARHHVEGYKADLVTRLRAA